MRMTKDRPLSGAYTKRINMASGHGDALSPEGPCAQLHSIGAPRRRGSWRADTGRILRCPTEQELHEMPFNPQRRLHWIWRDWWKQQINHRTRVRPLPGALTATTRLTEDTIECRHGRWRMPRIPPRTSSIGPVASPSGRNAAVRSRSSGRKSRQGGGKGSRPRGTRSRCSAPLTHGHSWTLAGLTLLGILLLLSQSCYAKSTLNAGNDAPQAVTDNRGESVDKRLSRYALPSLQEPTARFTLRRPMETLMEPPTDYERRRSTKMLLEPRRRGARALAGWMSQQLSQTIRISSLGALRIMETLMKPPTDHKRKRSTKALLKPRRRGTRALAGWISQQISQAIRISSLGTLRIPASQIVTLFGPSLIHSRRLLGRNAAAAIGRWIRTLRNHKIVAASAAGSTASLVGTAILASRQFTNETCQGSPPLPLACCEDKNNFPEGCCVGPEPLPTLCHPDLQNPPSCQPGSSNVFCQPLEESGWGNLVRRRRAPIPSPSAQEEPGPQADHQYQPALYLPLEPNVQHSVHKRAIFTIATLIASAISAIQLWIASATTAITAAAASTGAALSSAAATAATASTAVAAGAATALKAGAAVAATGIGHAALTVASGAASTIAVIGGEALERKQRVEAIATTPQPDPMPDTGNHTESRAKRNAIQTRLTEVNNLGYGYTIGANGFHPRFLRSPKNNTTDLEQENSRTTRSISSIFAAVVNWLRAIFSTTTGHVVKTVAKAGGAAATAGVGIAALDTIVRKVNQPENNLHLESANLQKPCWIPCNGITGFCSFCGANGRCCRRGYDIRGCDGEMGALEEHVCVVPATSDLEKAYDKVVKTEQEMRKNGDLDARHQRFFRILFDNERTRNAATYQKAWADYLTSKKAADSAPPSAPARANRTARSAGATNFLSHTERRELLTLLEKECTPTYPELYRDRLEALSFTCQAIRHRRKRAPTSSVRSGALRTFPRAPKWRQRARGALGHRQTQGSPRNVDPRVTQHQRSTTGRAIRDLGHWLAQLIPEDPLRFPSASGERSKSWKYDWGIVPHRPMDVPVFQERPGMGVILKVLGKAAVDVKYVPVDATATTKVLDVSISRLLGAAKEKLRRVMTQSGHNKHINVNWKKENPGLKPSVVKHLLRVEEVQRIGRRWINLRNVITNYPLTRPAEKDRFPRAARQATTQLQRRPQLPATNVSLNYLLTHKTEELSVLQGHLMGLMGESQTRTAHEKLIRQHTGPTFGISDSLVRSIDLLSKAVTRKRETWDADELFHDTWRHSLRYLDSIEQTLGAAALGRFPAAHAIELPWETVLGIHRREEGLGYEPLIGDPFGYFRAQSTLAAIKGPADLQALHNLVWIPLVQIHGRMTAYRVISPPVAMEEGRFVTLEPEQERILLVTRGAEQRSWTTLAATEWAACRPAGKFHTCPDIRATRPPVSDQVWPRSDPDVCTYALYARKAKLIASACVVRPVPESQRVISLGPFSWMTFTRHPVDLDLRCPRGTRHDATKITQLRGLGILQLPAGCQATSGGWQMFAETESTADAAQTIYPYEIPSLIGSIQEVAQEKEFSRSQVRVGSQHLREQGGPLYEFTRQKTWEDVTIADLQLKRQLTAFIDQHWSTAATIAVGILTLIIWAAIAFTMHGTSCLQEEASCCKTRNAERGRSLDGALRRVFSCRKESDSLERECAGAVDARLRGVECGLDAIARKLLVHQILTGGLPSRSQDYDKNISLPLYKSPGQLPVPQEVTLNSQHTNCNSIERETEETGKETARAPVKVPGPKQSRKK